MHLSTRWTRAAAVAALATVGLLGVAGTDASAAPAAQTDPVCATPVNVSFVGLTHTASGPAIRVRGITPYSTTRVDLVPEDVVYVQQPGYWNY